MKKTFLLLFFFLYLALNISSATTYFVANAGSDAANGTSIGTPWKTIAKVNGFSFASGSIVQFNRGDTWNLSTDAALNVPASNTTYTAYGSGALPIFDGHNAVANGIIASSKNHITIDSLQVQNLTGVDVLFSSCATCTITNSSLINGATHGMNVTGGSPSCTISGNTYSTTAAFNMAGKAFNIATTSGTCTIDSNTINLTNVLSTKNVSGIVSSASTIAPIVTNNTITMNQGIQGIGVKSVSAVSHTTGGTISGNSIIGITNSCTGCDGEGIELTGDVTHQVKNMVVTKNFIKLGSSAGDCLGAFHAIGNTVSYNMCIGNTNTNAGMHLSSNSDSNKFYGNDIYAPGANFGMELTGTAINNDFQNNIIVGSGYGIIFASGATGTYAYNDTFNNATANFSGGTNNGNNILTDPKWTSNTPTVSNDFKLLITSPDIETGNNLGTTYEFANDSGDTTFPYTSANQNSFGSAWERGAFVFISVVSTNSGFAGTSGVTGTAGIR